MPAAPIVTLTTDFGTGSPYVAAMKGVLMAGCPDARLVDVSHQVPAFGIEAAAFVLWAGTRDFAAGSVHLAVVDPGVGTARRAVAFEVAGRYYVGPDNGIFSFVVSEARPHMPTAVTLQRPAGASATFEGRDVFAPAAARLAAGTRLRDLGEQAPAPARLPERGDRVLWVDGFGNVVTSLRPPVRGIRIGGVDIRSSARTYGEAPSGLFFYTGSLGFVEVGVNGDRAAVLLDAVPGTPVSALS